MSGFVGQYRISYCWRNVSSGGLAVEATVSGSNRYYAGLNFLIVLQVLVTLQMTEQEYWQVYKCK